MPARTAYSQNQGRPRTLRIAVAKPRASGHYRAPTENPVAEPMPRADEISYLIDHAALYFERRLKPEDILGAFAGLRPLVDEAGARETASISREHVVSISGSGLITVAGEKRTPYCKIAEDAIAIGGLGARPCVTARLRLYGWQERQG